MTITPIKKKHGDMQQEILLYRYLLKRKASYRDGIFPDHPRKIKG
jgi:hypothetical protein